jgi:serine protease Do
VPPGPLDRSGTSVGSGFIIGIDGYVITNAHADGADEATRSSDDKRDFKAKVIGAISASTLRYQDRAKDLAVTTATRTSCGGQWVSRWQALCLENDDGRHVSARPDLPQENLVHSSRPTSPSIPATWRPCLPGETVGINSLIYSRTGGMGLAFAIPIDVAMNTVNS